MERDAQGFNAHVVREPGDVAIVELRGEVDIYTAARFRNTLAGLIDDGAERVVIDATAVTFLDSTGLGVFVSGERRLRPEGALAVACSRETARLFELVGLHHVFTLVRTRAEALLAVTATAGPDGAPAAQADPAT